MSETNGELASGGGHPDMVCEDVDEYIEKVCVGEPGEKVSNRLIPG